MFEDAKGRWSENDILRAAKAGLMTGYEDGTFQPVVSVTREQLASVLSRLLFRDGLFTDVLPEILPAVVTLHRADGGLGSGSYIAPNLIITNQHVVNGFTELTVMKEGKPNVPGEVLAISDRHDLALVQTGRTSAVFLRVAEKDVEQGDHVGMLGAPRGYMESFTQGQVSHVLRATDPISDPDCFQTDAPINHGNSGGPAINERGELVGVSVAKVVGVGVEGIGFCIHAKYVREFCQQCGVNV